MRKVGVIDRNNFSETDVISDSILEIFWRGFTKLSGISTAMSLTVSFVSFILTENMTINSVNSA